MASIRYKRGTGRLASAPEFLNVRVRGVDRFVGCARPSVKECATGDTGQSTGLIPEPVLVDGSLCAGAETQGMPPLPKIWAPRNGPWFAPPRSAGENPGGNPMSWYKSCTRGRMTYHPDIRHDWQPSELGFFRSAASAIVVCVALIFAVTFLNPGEHPKPPQIVTQARMVQLPPPPPPPPQIVQPPEPLEPPPIKPPEAPVQAKIQVKKPPPKVVHHVVKRPPPPQHVEPRPDLPPPPPNTPVATTPPPPSAPPVERTSGVGPYGRGLHDKIQSNVEIPPAVSQLQLDGTVVIAFVVSPSGAVSGVHVVRSSGNRLIDAAAVTAVKGTRYPPFGPDMPTHALPFTVPIEINGAGG